MGSTQKHYLKINPYLDIISGITVVLSFSDGIIKIIGREGTGKSVLTQLLAADLMEEEQEVVIFSDVPHSENELHNPIQDQLHLDLGENTDFYAALNSHIQARPFEQQKLILVFDDADQIPDDCFDAIRMLFEKNYHDRPEVSMVFAGTELLDQKLNEKKNRTFNKNIILNFEVKPMNRSELEAFCNAYLVEMGLQKHHIDKQDMDEIFTETQGLPGKIPQLIFDILDREEEQKKVVKKGREEEKSVMSKLVKLDDDPAPELTGLSVDDREDILFAYKDQVPWRWQSNGVGIAVLVLLLVVFYGYFVPVEDRTNSIVIIPPPSRSPGQFSTAELTALAETLVQQNSAQLTQIPLTAESIREAEDSLVEAQSELPATTELETENIAQQEEAAVAEPESIAQQQEDTVVDPEITEPEQGIEEVIADSGPEAESIAEPVEPEVIAAADITEVVEEPEPVVAPEPAPAPTVEEQEPVVAQQAASDPQTFIDNWLAAWESQDVRSYVQAYHSEFSPAGVASREAWMDERSTSINRPSSIDIDMEDFEVVDESNNQATVRLQFTYESPNYADRTVKELVLAVENGDWAIREERNVSIERLAVAGAGSTTSADSASNRLAAQSDSARTGESGFEAIIREVLSMAMPDRDQLNTPYGIFIDGWLDAWKSQDVEGYFSHYHDNFEPANFDSMSDWRADRTRKINEKSFIEIAFDDIEVVNESEDSTRIRFWISYVSSFYLDRTFKEVVISQDSGSDGFGIVEERNLEVEIIPFYPFPYASARQVSSLIR